MRQINGFKQPDLPKINRNQSQVTHSPLDSTFSISISCEEPEPLTPEPLTVDDYQASAHPAVRDLKADLEQELAAARQMLQYQQELIDALNEQLLISQETITEQENQLFLECQRSAEQLHLLDRAQANCQDLRCRLQRQQQQTLQFKAALERCIEARPKQHSSSQTGLATTSLQMVLKLSSKLNTNGQPIQSWSAPGQDNKADKSYTIQPTQQKSPLPIAPEPAAPPEPQPSFQPCESRRVELPNLPRP